MSATPVHSCRISAASPADVALLRDALALLLPDAVVREDGAAGGGGAGLVVTLPPVDASNEALAKARRRLAAGEGAAALQHSMNNPLTAILAESQLLALEELPADAAGAVARIVENTRRLIALVRKLGGSTPQ
jgi:signal transduction histidine kinase